MNDENYAIQGFQILRPSAFVGSSNVAPILSADPEALIERSLTINSPLIEIALFGPLRQRCPARPNPEPHDRAAHILFSFVVGASKVGRRALHPKFSGIPSSVLRPPGLNQV